MISPTPSQLSTYAEAFQESLVKVSYIRKRKDKWVVLSEKGKVLGSYKTKPEAVKRLKQIEWFKSHPKKTKKKASKEDTDTYSSIMRSLNKDNNHDAMISFQTTFKQAFDAAYIAGEEHPEETALEKAKAELNEKTAELKAMLVKTAAAIELGPPEEAGAYMAALVKFLLKRISPDKRPKAIQAMKRKIYYINEYQVASKRTPPSSSMGQSITIIKNLLLEHPAEYVRLCLNSIVKHL
jgi:hypothetical protein